MFLVSLRWAICHLKTPLCAVTPAVFLPLLDTSCRGVFFFVIEYGASPVSVAEALITRGGIRGGYDECVNPSWSTSPSILITKWGEKST